VAVDGVAVCTVAAVAVAYFTVVPVRTAPVSVSKIFAMVMIDPEISPGIETTGENEPALLLVIAMFQYKVPLTVILT